MASFAVVKRDQNMPLLRAGGHSRLPSPVTSVIIGQEHLMALS